MSTYTYELGDSLYINLTNRCNNSCTFCIKFRNRKFENKFDLWLEKEPSAREILDEIHDVSKYRQIVFCGYGESLIRLGALKEIATELKAKGANIRIDTDGQANLFHGRDVLPELKGLVDEMNISLNAQDKETYNRLCRPVFSEDAYDSIKQFASKAKEHIPKVTLSVVGLQGVDADLCRAEADKIGVGFRLRPYYEETYKT